MHILTHMTCMSSVVTGQGAAAAAAAAAVDGDAAVPNGRQQGAQGSRSSSAPCTHIQWKPNTSGGVRIIPASAVLLLDGEVVEVETGTGATSSTVATLQAEFWKLLL
jgi:hypothetical protein